MKQHTTNDVRLVLRHESTNDPNEKRAIRIEMVCRSIFNPSMRLALKTVRGE